MCMSLPGKRRKDILKLVIQKLHLAPSFFAMCMTKDELVSSILSKVLPEYYVADLVNGLSKRRILLPALYKTNDRG
ncbi:hypothetical protein F0562_030286 [Nyssa sinensis]|uniref:Uncharacterized protein n=1 Tax=Nyssa sinensis TaxID=561372 RepID=A0A5J5AWI1_9ASTE|nr:hypothetical protein F0562_030286 [Nyssa sinensis]